MTPLELHPGNMGNLHAIARKHADRITTTGADLDRKQLRFNDIVECAVRFYPSTIEAGVIELVNACDRNQPDLYLHKSPMWQTLSEQYKWMI